MSDTPPEDPLVPYKRFVCQVGRRLGVDSKTIGKKKGEKIDKMLNRVIEALDAKLAAPAKIIDDLMKEREASEERDERKAKEHLAFQRQQAAQDQEKGLPPLPSGWTIARNDDGRVFYHHALSDKTQWKRPEAPAAVSAPVRERAPPPDPVGEVVLQREWPSSIARQIVHEFPPHFSLVRGAEFFDPKHRIWLVVLGYKPRSPKMSVKVASRSMLTRKPDGSLHSLHGRHVFWKYAPTLVHKHMFANNPAALAAAQAKYRAATTGDVALTAGGMAAHAEIMGGF